MNIQFKHILTYSSLICASLFTSCNDFLDRQPLSSVTQEQYFNTEADIASYANNYYNFSTHGGYNIGVLGLDNNTDNQASMGGSTGRWVPSEWRVGASGGDWSFGRIRALNFFLQEVLPRVEAGEVSGNDENIMHYVGEIYFLRAWEYYGKLVALGDFPIITEVLPDDYDILLKASERRPRTEVARFILEDLDRAIELLKDNPNGGKNRITRNAALLVKSRVALFEGSWLTYHKGTAFVPKGPGWPGNDRAYLKDFKFDIDSEINFFLEEAMVSSKEVADQITLTESTDVLMPDTTGTAFAGWNPYFDMFTADDMSSYSEVIMWRDYDNELNVNHAVSHYLVTGGGDYGLTKGYVDGFVMANGLPIYANGSNYAGDESLADVKKDRDLRLSLFLVENGQPNALANGKWTTFGLPPITENREKRSTTGYNLTKTMSYDPSQSKIGHDQTYGCIVFRGAEAYLNYLEACYIKNGNIDATADKYWKAIRRRARINEDYMVSINATDLTQEDDWAVYSAGNMVDETLYNIRKERRNEFIGEGFRYNDLKRWRSLDQVKDYQIQGFNLWTDYAAQYEEAGIKLFYGDVETPNVSSPNASDYLRPYQINEDAKTNLLYNGYTWLNCKYLSPIAQSHFAITTLDGVLENSVIYQNPGWPYIANQPGHAVN